MVTFELIETYDDGYLYAYYPEGNKEYPGYIGIRNGERFIKRLSEAEAGTMYARQCFRHLKGQRHGMAAWY